jgi:Na+-transporting NADH:ubiquinone oxidoreductase subunit F
VDGGSTLLYTLGNNGVFLAISLVEVVAPVCNAVAKWQQKGEEASSQPKSRTSSRKEIADNWRFGCQVKVKEDMDIQVPEEVFGIKKWECEVVSNYNVASFIKEYVVRLAGWESLWILRPADTSKWMFLKLLWTTRTLM